MIQVVHPGSKFRIQESKRHPIPDQEHCFKKKKYNLLTLLDNFPKYRLRLIQILGLCPSIPTLPADKQLFYHVKLGHVPFNTLFQNPV